MKIKQVFAQILLSICVLLVTRFLVGGFVFSHSSTLVAMFLALFAATDWVTVRVRIFFLLPSLLPIPILIHSAIIGLLFYVANHYISGISIVALNPQFLAAFNKFLPLQNFGEFGTIVMVSLFCGIVYQTINWLYTEK